MSAAPLRQSRASTRSRAGTRQAAAREAAERPQLRSVRAPEASRALMPFMWMCIAVVLAALAAVLLINTTMAEGAYERRDLKIEIAQLHQEGEALRTTLEESAAPGALASRAQDLGMVPAETRGSLFLSDGIVVDSGTR